jgi:hypothetical protein
MKQDYSIKDILNAVNDILIAKPIKESTKNIIDQVSIKNDSAKKLISNSEFKKENKVKKKYDLIVINNAKDVLILNRIIFK